MAEKVKIAIVGSGPGGLSAAARAAKLGVSHILLERTSHFSDTIYKYQKRKPVMATPNQLPLRSDLAFEEGSREQILGAWDEGMAALSNVKYRLNAEVTAITGQKGDFKLKLITGEVIEAEYVILGIGLQGNLRKLDVPGNEWERVQYQLDDPDEYKDEDIIIIGGGDAGIENALALSENNNVTMINNHPDFIYAKGPNATAIRAKIQSGLIQAFMSSTAKKIAPGLLTLNVPEGEAQVPCNRIIARIGALPPRKFVEGCGVKFATDAPTAFPNVSEIYESNMPGLYIIGALAGYPLIKQCMNQGYEVVEYIQGNQIAPADEPLIVENFVDLPQPIPVNTLIDRIRQNIPLFAALTRLQVRELLLQSKVHFKRPGDTVFQVNDYTNSLYAVIDGTVEIVISENKRVPLRTGQFFGEMGLISGRRRTATVLAQSECLLIEVNRNHMIRLQRSVPEVKRAIDEVAIVRQIRTYLKSDISDEIIDRVVKASKVMAFKPKDVLIEEGATDDNVYLIRSGSVVITRKSGNRDVTLAYRSAGNYVGEMATMTNARRSATVRAAVQTEAIKIDSDAFRALIESDSELMKGVQEEVRQHLLGTAKLENAPEKSDMVGFMVSQGLSEATDVLLIDEALCVRCDNCEKACAETHHGVSRLNREAGPTYGTLHVPTSCRHCEHPHCMKDCPPDAIRRDPNGEVYIDGETCIGCGNCERNCPYGVIQMAAVPGEKPSLFSWLFFGRGPGPGEDKSAEGMSKRTGGLHAVKCDMCSGLSGGPACVRACPTGAAIRVDPSRYIQAITELST
jgi:Fe-S-cluster-containing hydrogenase component 2/CRP-like cAMP-binding protein/thioredoxin reductase